MFKIDNIKIDRVQSGIAENSNGDILYILTHLSDLTIDVTANSKDITDENGNLIKKVYTGKLGSVTSNNSFLSFDLLSAVSGTAKTTASSGNKFTMPCIKTVAAGDATINLKGVVEGTVKVEGINGAGNRIATYTKDTAAAEQKFSITGEVLTLPTDSSVTNFIIKYDRDAENAVKVINDASKFPKTVRLTLKALAVDPCDPEAVKACYIVIPSFQVSPETSVSLTTEGQLAYNGDIQTSYCGAEKVLYEVYMADEEDE